MADLKSSLPQSVASFLPPPLSPPRFVLVLVLVLVLDSLSFARAPVSAKLFLTNL
jgi:hypothetical protein